MVFVLTYGLSGRTIMAHDKSYDYMELVKEFFCENLPALANKPKFFFIQTAQAAHAQSFHLEECSPTEKLESNLLIGYNSGTKLNIICS